MSMYFQFGASHTLFSNLAVAGLGTALGALSGSWLSFWLERRTRKKEETARNITAGNLALMELIQYWKWLIDYRDEFITPAAALPCPWINGQTAYPRDYDEAIRLDSGRLAFLFVPDADLVPSLLVKQNDSRTILRLLERRFELVDRARTAPKITGFNPRDRAHWQITVGPEYVNELQSSYEFLVRSVTVLIKTIPPLFSRLREVLLDKFPSEKDTIIDARFEDPASNIEAPAPGKISIDG